MAKRFPSKCSLFREIQKWTPLDENQEEENVSMNEDEEKVRVFKHARSKRLSSVRAWSIMDFMCRLYQQMQNTSNRPSDDRTHVVIIQRHSRDIAQSSNSENSVLTCKVLRRPPVKSPSLSSESEASVQCPDARTEILENRGKQHVFKHRSRPRHRRQHRNPHKRSAVSRSELYKWFHRPAKVMITSRRYRHTRSPSPRSSSADPPSRDDDGSQDQEHESEGEDSSHSRSEQSSEDMSEFKARLLSFIKKSRAANTHHSQAKYEITLKGRGARHVREPDIYHQGLEVRRARKEIEQEKEEKRRLVARIKVIEEREEKRMRELEETLERIKNTVVQPEEENVIEPQKMQEKEEWAERMWEENQPCTKCQDKRYRVFQRRYRSPSSQRERWRLGTLALRDTSMEQPIQPTFLEPTEATSTQAEQKGKEGGGTQFDEFRQQTGTGSQTKGSNTIAEPYTKDPVPSCPWYSETKSGDDTSKHIIYFQEPPKRRRSSEKHLDTGAATETKEPSPKSALESHQMHMLESSKDDTGTSDTSRESSSPFREVTSKKVASRDKKRKGTQRKTCKSHDRWIDDRAMSHELMRKLGIADSHAHGKKTSSRKTRTKQPVTGPHEHFSSFHIPKGIGRDKSASPRSGANVPKLTHSQSDAKESGSGKMAYQFGTWRSDYGKTKPALNVGGSRSDIGESKWATVKPADDGMKEPVGDTVKSGDSDFIYSTQESDALKEYGQEYGSGNKEFEYISEAFRQDTTITPLEYKQGSDYEMVKSVEPQFEQGLGTQGKDEVESGGGKGKPSGGEGEGREDGISKPEAETVTAVDDTVHQAYDISMPQDETCKNDIGKTGFAGTSTDGSGVMDSTVLEDIMESEYVTEKLDDAHQGPCPGVNESFDEKQGPKYDSSTAADAGEKVDYGIEKSGEVEQGYRTRFESIIQKYTDDKQPEFDFAKSRDENKESEYGAKKQTDTSKGLEYSIRKCPSSTKKSSMTDALVIIGKPLEPEQKAKPRAQRVEPTKSLIMEQVPYEDDLTAFQQEAPLPQHGSEVEQITRPSTMSQVAMVDKEDEGSRQTSVQLQEDSGGGGGAMTIGEAPAVTQAPPAPPAPAFDTSPPSVLGNVGELMSGPYELGMSFLEQLSKLRGRDVPIKFQNTEMRGFYEPPTPYPVYLYLKNWEWLSRFWKDKEETWEADEETLSSKCLTPSEVAKPQPTAPPKREPSFQFEDQPTPSFTTSHKRPKYERAGGVCDNLRELRLCCPAVPMPRPQSYEYIWVHPNEPLSWQYDPRPSFRSPRGRPIPCPCSEWDSGGFDRYLTPCRGWSRVIRQMPDIWAHSTLDRTSPYMSSKGDRVYYDRMYYNKMTVRNIMSSWNRSKRTVSRKRNVNYLETLPENLKVGESSDGKSQVPATVSKTDFGHDPDMFTLYKDTDKMMGPLMDNTDWGSHVNRKYQYQSGEDTRGQPNLNASKAYGQSPSRWNSKEFVNTQEPPWTGKQSPHIDSHLVTKGTCVRKSYSTTCTCQQGQDGTPSHHHRSCCRHPLHSDLLCSCKDTVRHRGDTPTSHLPHYLTDYPSSPRHMISSYNPCFCHICRDYGHSHYRTYTYPPVTSTLSTYFHTSARPSHQPLNYHRCPPLGSTGTRTLKSFMYDLSQNANQWSNQKDPSAKKQTDQSYVQPTPSADTGRNESLDTKSTKSPRCQPGGDLWWNGFEPQPSANNSKPDSSQLKQVSSATFFLHPKTSVGTKYPAHTEALLAGNCMRLSCSPLRHQPRSAAIKPSYLLNTNANKTDSRAHHNSPQGCLKIKVRMPSAPVVERLNRRYNPSETSTQDPELNHYSTEINVLKQNNPGTGELFPGLNKCGRGVEALELKNHGTGRIIPELNNYSTGKIVSELKNYGTGKVVPYDAGMNDLELNDYGTRVAVPERNSCCTGINVPELTNYGTAKTVAELNKYGIVSSVSKLNLDNLTAERDRLKFNNYGGSNEISVLNNYFSESKTLDLNNCMTKHPSFDRKHTPAPSVPSSDMSYLSKLSASSQVNVTNQHPTYGRFYRPRGRSRRDYYESTYPTHAGSNRAFQNDVRLSTVSQKLPILHNSKWSFLDVARKVLANSKEATSQRYRAPSVNSSATASAGYFSPIRQSRTFQRRAASSGFEANSGLYLARGVQSSGPSRARRMTSADSQWMTCFKRRKSLSKSRSSSPCRSRIISPERPLTFLRARNLVNDIIL